MHSSSLSHRAQVLVTTYALISPHLDLFRNRFEESAKRSVSRFLAGSSLQNQRSLQLEDSRHMVNLQPSMYGPPQKRN